MKPKVNNAYIESALKLKKLNQLQTGDLVKFEADVMPIIFHYGIVRRSENKIYIYHNQTSLLNKSGGSLIMEDLFEYAKGRKIKSIEKTGLDEDQISSMIDILENKKYDLVNNNCEHFINALKTNNFQSPTVAKIGLGLIVGLSSLYLIKMI